MIRMFDDPKGLMSSITTTTKIGIEELKTDGWESPIQVAVERISNELNDALVVEIKQRIGVDIDEKKLLDALAYSHQSWLDGYAAGQKDAVKHGYWIIGDWHKSDGVYPNQGKKCSHCFRTAHITDVPWDSTYCPWCGAKMDEEVNHDDAE